MGYLLLAGAGLLGYLLFSSKSSASTLPGGVTPPPPSAGDQFLAAQATAQAQAFNAQAQALGLNQAQAQQASDLGLSPQDYVNSGMGQGTANPYIGTGG
jgi:hypothetical protein